MPIRILSVNAWNAPNDRTLRTTQLIETVKKLQVDVLCMQEVDEQWQQDLRTALEGYHFQIDNNLMVASQFPIVSSKTTNVLSTTIQMVHVKGRNGRARKGDFAIANLHLPKGSNEYVERTFRKLVRIEHKDTIITGDFNRGKIEIPKGWEVASLSPTWPSWKSPIPPMQLDWTLYRLSNYKVDLAVVMKGLYISDHLPTLLELSPLKN